MLLRGLACNPLIIVMKPHLLALTNCALFGILVVSPPLSAQDTKDDPDLFKIFEEENSKADPKAPGSTPPAATPSGASKLPPTVDLILDKWQQYEEAKKAKMHEMISARRKIAVEILTKRTEAASAEQKAAVQQLANLKPEDPLRVSISAQQDPRLSVLTGYWNYKGGKWDRTFWPNGIVDAANGRMPWRWLDKEAGILIQGTSYVDLMFMESDSLIRGINTGKDHFTMKKEPDPAGPASSDATMQKLAEDEIADRLALEQSLTNKRRVLAKYLRIKAKKVSDEESEKMLKSRANRLDDMLYEPNGAEERIAGVWSLPSKKVRFKAEGEMVDADSGAVLGKWAWANGRKSTFVFYFSARPTADQIFLANAPSYKGDNEISLFPMIGEHTRISRIPD